MATIIDSYSESNCNWFDIPGNQNMGAYPYWGQSFTGNGQNLDKVKLYLSKEGSPTGSATVSIYAHSGEYGTTGIPTGNILATSDTFDISALTESYQLVDFPFSGANRINLGDGTRYFLVIDCPDSSGNYVKIGIDTSSPTHGGNEAYYNNGWYYRAGTDMCFYVYGEDSTTPIVGEKYPLPPFRRSV